MIERYGPDCMAQFSLWEKLGFPSTGSFSTRQADQLKVNLEKKEREEKLKKRKEGKEGVNWKAYSMWKEGSVTRECKANKNRDKHEKCV